jgi:hypothetical protein
MNKMKKIALIFSLLFLFVLDAPAQNKTASVTVSADFKSDGCTMFPDGDYLDCCVEHDRAYYVGGSWTERWRADRKLYKCVAAKRGFKHKIIAPVMWLGVRIGGVPWIPTPFRWGFGRKKPPKPCERKCVNVLTSK